MAGMDRVKEWVATIREDIEALKAVVSAEDADDEARRFAAAGLNYLIARMDLVPDWEESIGIMDDAMILRIAADLASQHGLGDDFSAADTAKIGRLTNEIGTIEKLLGATLYAQLRTYFTRLKDETVRGRAPSQLIADAKLRDRLYEEIEADLARMPPAPFTDPDALLAKFKSYLHHKLDDK